MPWYQAGAPRGFTKFYDQGSYDPDRSDRFAVSNSHIEGLMQAFKSSYLAAGGKLFSAQTWAEWLDRMAEHNVNAPPEAAAYGVQRAGEENAGATGLLTGGFTTGGPGIVPVENPDIDKDRRGIITSSAPVGQPTTQPVGFFPAPTPATAGPPGALGYSTDGGAAVMATGNGMGLWLVLGLVGVGAYLLWGK